jgi:hypothetical protein
MNNILDEIRRPGHILASQICCLSCSVGLSACIIKKICFATCCIYGFQRSQIAASSTAVFPLLMFPEKCIKQMIYRIHRSATSFRCAPCIQELPVSNRPESWNLEDDAELDYDETETDTNGMDRCAQ